MKKTTKILSLLLACFVGITCVVSCTEENSPVVDELPDTLVKIVDNGKTEYRVVRSDTNETGASAAAKMRSVMESVTDSEVKLMNDFEHEKLGTMRTDYEILVGVTNREESSMHEREFTYLDYAIDMDTTRLSITGGSSAALISAVEYIQNNYVSEDTKSIIIPKGNVVEYYHDYPVDSITIGGRDFEDFVIVASNGDSRPYEFANKFYGIYGKTLGVKTPGYKDASDCEIILSSANDERYTDVFAKIGDFEYMYKIEGTKIYIGTSGEVDDNLAWEMFVTDIFGEDISALNGNIEIKNCTRTEEVDHAPTLEFTSENQKEVDEKAEELKNTIMNSANIDIPEGAVFYVSPNGDDANDGRTPETAWKTLTPVNNVDFEEGTHVLFERGGLWRGMIKAKRGVTYSAYGEGAKPALYGGHEDGAIPEKWTLMEGTDNIWIYADEMIDTGTLVFNHGEQHAYKEIPSYIDGFKKRTAPEEEFDIIEALDVDLDFFHAADSVLHNGKYPTSGTAEGEIYLRCDAGNPGEVFDSIEFVPRHAGFSVIDDNVTIDNFTIKYIGAHGVSSGTRTGLTVQNCEFGWIGGGIQSYAANGNTTQSATRFGNAIEIYGGCEDFDVHNCYIYQVYDAGITHQYKSENFVKMSNVSYYNNLVEDCVYSIEYFLNSSDNPEQSMYNIKMYDNILRRAGFGWGNQRPDKGSAAHIKGWDHDNPAVDFEIYNNIMDRSSNWMIHCGYKDKEFEPKIYGNTFIQYHDGLFGRYDVIPTHVIAYGNEMLADERLFDNNFYFINDENVPKCIADRGTLSLKHKGMPIYRNGEYIELHGTKITDGATISDISTFFDAAILNMSIFTGFGGEYGEGTIDIDGYEYTKFLSCDTMDALQNIAKIYFDENLLKSFTGIVTPSGVPVFVQRNDELYRLSGYFAQYSFNDAKWRIDECRYDTDGVISVKVHMTFDGMEADTVYKLVKDENGAYKFTSAFVLPIELMTAYDLT